MSKSSDDISGYEKLEYRGYEIQRVYPPVPGVWFGYCHKEYDGAPEHSYGPPSDLRCGVANSVDEAKEEIDEIEGEL